MYTLKNKSNSTAGNNNAAERGSLFVDAAVSLPIFAVALALLLMLIALCGMENTMYTAMIRGCIDAEKGCVASVSAKSAEGITASADDGDLTAADKTAAIAAYAASLHSFVKKEWNGGGPDINSGSCLFTKAMLSDGTAVNNVLSVTGTLKVPFPFSLVLYDNLTVKKQICVRPFCGESPSAGEYDDTRVYVFPKRGECYHNSSCSCLKNGEIQTVLTPSLKKKCTSCKLCHPDSLCEGAAVFLFSGASSVYHRKSCASITKAFEAVTISDAVSMGYKACRLCGGAPGAYIQQNDHFAR